MTDERRGEGERKDGWTINSCKVKALLRRGGADVTKGDEYTFFGLKCIKLVDTPVCDVTKSQGNGLLCLITPTPGGFIVDC